MNTRIKYHVLIVSYLFNLINITQSNMIYTVDNIENVYSPDNITKITNWNGEPNTVGDDMSIEYPYVTRIDTLENTFNHHGYVNNGENFIILYFGSLIANNVTLNCSGEVFWTTIDNHVNISILPYSSAFIIGSKYELTQRNRFVESVPRKDVDKQRAFLRSTVGKVAHDDVINDGTADAVDYMWGATNYTPPLVIVEMWTKIGHISMHQHPKGVVYLPLNNCKICYCYDDNNDNCICTNDGEVRHEYAGKIYREIITVVNDTKHQSCKFVVFEFYPFQSGGFPQFYPSYDILNGTTIVVSPLRLKSQYKSSSKLS